MAEIAGVVLVGGRSSRMGAPKAALEWHGSTLLRRVTGILARGLDGPVLVVRAPGQPLPPLPAGVEVLHDVHGHRQPLAACYRTSLADAAARLIAADRLRPAHLFDGARVVHLDESDLLADPALRRADPELDSVAGVNTPADYRAARDRPAPSVTVQRFGVLASGGESGDRTVRAASLGAAATAVGVVLDRHVLAALNGDQMSRDPEVPLVGGDVVTFLSADAGG